MMLHGDAEIRIVMKFVFCRLRVMATVAALGAAALTTAVPAAPATAPNPAVAEDDILARIERYLNDVQSMEAGFIQEAPDGVVTEGKLSLERPGKLRFEYKGDIPLLVVADGSTLTFVDYDVKQVTRWPIGETPLGILVARNIDLRKDLETTVTRGADKLIRVRIVDPKRADQGFMTLIFEDRPLALRAWEVTDPQGYETRVTIVNPVYNTDIADALFTFKDPRSMPFSGRRGPR